MKKLVEFLVTLKSLIELGGLILAAILTLIAWLMGIASIPIILPLGVAIFLVAICGWQLLTICIKLIQPRSVKLFSYRGLLWKPRLFWFDNPIPICPHEGCGCEVSAKREPDVRVRSSNAPLLRVDTVYVYTYECPRHGKLNGVPSDIGINQLATDAKQIQDHPTKRG